MPVIETPRTTGQVAELLGVRLFRLQYLLRTGQLPDLPRLGVHRLWTSEAIEQARRLLAGQRDDQQDNRGVG